MLTLCKVSNKSLDPEHYLLKGARLGIWTLIQCCVPLFLKSQINTLKSTPLVGPNRSIRVTLGFPEMLLFSFSLFFYTYTFVSSLTPPTTDVTRVLTSLAPIEDIRLFMFNLLTPIRILEDFRTKGRPRKQNRVTLG